VHGIDASPAIVAKMREAGQRIFGRHRRHGRRSRYGQFLLVFIVFNTFFMLLTQKRRRCFATLPLTLLGRLLLPRSCPTCRVEPARTSVSTARRSIACGSTTTCNRLDQRLDTTQIRITPAGNELIHTKLRCAWPSNST
jgi:hypothetical protein